MVSCRMFTGTPYDLAVPLSKTCEVRVPSREIPVFPPLRGMQGALFVYTWAQGARQFPCNLSCT